jgi:integrase
MGQYKKKDRKKNPWFYRFKFRGKIYKQEGFTSYAEALQAEARKREELSAPAIAQILLVSLAMLGDDYLTYCMRRGMAHNTVRQKAFVYRKFLGYLGQDLPAAYVAGEHIEGFLSSCIERGVPETNSKGNIQYREVNPKTVNRYRRDLSALFSFATNKKNRRKYGLIENPCDVVEEWPEDEAARYIPPVEDMKKVRAVAALGDEMDLIECLYFTGARLGSILRLPWEDVNFEKRILILSIRKRGTKGTRRTVKQMNPALLNILHRRWRHRDKASPYVFNLGQYQVRNMMAKLCKKAKVKPFTFHAIRHHVSSILADRMKAGQVSLKDIQNFLDHERASTTEIYIHSLGGHQGIGDLLEIIDQEKSVTQCNAKAESEKVG